MTAGDLDLVLHEIESCAGYAQVKFAPAYHVHLNLTLTDQNCISAEFKIILHRARDRYSKIRLITLRH